MHALSRLYKSTLAFKARLFTLMPALLAITVLAFASTPVAHAQPDITIETVPIGQPYNEADTTGYGSVSYEYYIGKTEVTNAQYAIFLNAVAQQSDPYELYSENMGNNARGGITRSESEGNYTYTVKEGYDLKPVNYISFYDAARFCNWLTNGATTDPTSTETGMYTLSDGGLGMTRDADAWAAGGYAITSEDEWYKAAYYKLTEQRYTTYATGSSITTSQANYSNSYYDTHGQTDSERIAPAGSYLAEQNGTFDMMGNVWEWNESVISETYRGLRGGAYNSSVDYLEFSGRNGYENPSYGNSNFGFRVSQLASVPEPATYGILGGAAALLGAVALRRRNRHD